MACTQRASTEDQLVARRAGGAQGEEVVSRGGARLARGGTCLACACGGVGPGVIWTEGSACVAREVGLVGCRHTRRTAANVAVSNDGGRRVARATRVVAGQAEVCAVWCRARWAHRGALTTRHFVGCVGARYACVRARAVTRAAGSMAGSANAAAVAEQPGGASGHARTTEQVGPEPWLRIPVARLVLLRDRWHAPHRPGIPRLAATQAGCAVGRAARVAIEVEARPALAVLPLRPGAVVTARHHARTARKHSTWRAVEGIERRRGARYALEVDTSLVARAIAPGHIYMGGVNVYGTGVYLPFIARGAAWYRWQPA